MKTKSYGRIAVAIMAGGMGLAGSARGQIFTEFPLPFAGSGAGSIAAGPDGNLWFTEGSIGRVPAVSRIGRITTAGAVTEFELPCCSSVRSIAAGPDGNLWFTEESTDKFPYIFKIGRITTAGVVTEFPAPAGSGPLAIAAGADGNLWFVENISNKIGRITPAGVITEFTLPTADSLPQGIAAGPDGNLWFTEFGKIGRITPAGVITEFPLLHALCSVYPYDCGGGTSITAGPDGNLWFTEGITEGLKPVRFAIGRITTAGVVTEFPRPAPSQLSAIAAGPDGNLWFTDFDVIARITPSGAISEFPLPRAGLSQGIVAGPDGNMWFTFGDIWRLNLLAVCGFSPTSLCLNNGRFRAEATWTTSDGKSGAGQAVSLTPDAGYFWFFSSNNIELVVKVLNGCSFNNHYWVFASGLTNVRVVLTVTDTVTGAVATYNSPQGTAFQPIQDTSAFACL